jgi:RND superfamily putative drug exporter
MALLLHRLGALAFRRRLTVILAWVFILAALGVGAGTLSGKTTDSFNIPGVESVEAMSRISDKFGGPAQEDLPASYKVVFETRGKTKITDPEAAGLVAKSVQELAALPGVASVSNPFDETAPTVAPDLRAAYATVTYKALPIHMSEADKDALTDKVDEFDTDTVTALAAPENAQDAPPHGAAGEGVAIVLALIILAVTYGSLVAAGMTLLTALVGVGIGIAGITTLTGFVELSSTTPTLAVMLGLAVGIDYALFIFTRFRHELLDGRSVKDAVAMATGTAGSAVVTAGLTVIIALVGLYAAGIPFLTQMGLGAAFTVALAVLVAVTLVPAVLGYLGHRVLPKKARKTIAEHTGEPQPHDFHDRGFLTGWAKTVTRHRWLVLIGGVAALLVMSVPVLSMQTSLVQQVDPDTREGQAAAVIADHFGAGVAGPLVVLVDGEGAATTGAAITKKASALPDVAAALPAQPSPDGTAALVTVIPKSGPESEATANLVRDLRETFQTDDGPDVYVTGQTAVDVDIADKLNDALPIYLLLVVGLAFLLLVLVFRSLLVPLVGVLGFLLSVGAAFGATVAVFQWGWAAAIFGVDATGPLLSLMPILVVGILFGLAMDYQVFLVSRIHEAQAHGATPRDAIVSGFKNAAPVVVAAALIMFAVFAGFAIPGEGVIKAIGFALAVGVAVDAFVVRMLIVPAAIALLGTPAWALPKWLEWLPVLDVEGEALRTAEPVTAHRAEPSLTD